MNNFERVRDLVNEYVRENGTDTEMSRGEFLEWVHQTYDNISAAKNNLYPTDISYNLYNAGLVDFPGPNLCLVYVEERDKFRLVGTGYKFTGSIWQYKNKKNEQVVGHWENGVCSMDSSKYDEQLAEAILLRREDIADWLKSDLKGAPIDVKEAGRDVRVEFQGVLICGIHIEDEGYKIYNASSEWKEKTTYRCEEAEDGTWFYYVETSDEAIGQVELLFKFEAQKGKGIDAGKENGTSELRRILSPEQFEKSFSAFMIQAEKNAVSKKSQGPRYPEGFENNKHVDGCNFSQHFGQGAASKTPYFNWHVVSIYYLVDISKIIIGIEVSRYPHIGKMKPLRIAQLGNRQTGVAVFYETTKEKIDYQELYDKFLGTSEEVLRLGIR